MIIIGIAGGSGSGKTTVVKRIAKALPPHCAAVIPLDSYYKSSRWTLITTTLPT